MYVYMFLISHIFISLQCLSVDELTAPFNLHHGDAIPVSMLPDLSLALVQQLYGNYCVVESVESTNGEPSALESRNYV